MTSYDHPDASRLIEELQQEYVVRYGGIDDTPVDPAQFAPPTGLFLVGYVDRKAVACGGWRAAVDPELSVSDAEIKRMYVTGAMRGRGLSRLVLAELERLAAESGYRRLALETGEAQPEALALYRSAGYFRIPGFGLHQHEPLSVCLAKILLPVGTPRDPGNGQPRDGHAPHDDARS